MRDRNNGTLAALRPRPGDWVLAGLLVMVMVLVPVLTIQGATGALTAVVTQDGRQLARIRLDDVAGAEHLAYGGDAPGTILVENGRIRFEEAHCPDQVCVGTGWLTRAGQTAACLPAKVLIRIEGTETGDVDVQLQ